MHKYKILFRNILHFEDLIIEPCYPWNHFSKIQMNIIIITLPLKNFRNMSNIYIEKISLHVNLKSIFFKRSFLFFSVIFRSYFAFGSLLEILTKPNLYHFCTTFDVIFYISFLGVFFPTSPLMPIIMTSH